MTFSVGTVRLHGLILMIAALWGAGSAGAQTGYKAVPVRDGGVIRGRVLLQGQVPRVEALQVTKDKEICGPGVSAPSRLLLGKENGVRNAVVYLEAISEGKNPPAPKRAVLDQRRCEFTPHVLVLYPGQQLDVVNSDRVLHNVHAYGLGEEKQTLFNIAQPVKGQKSAIDPAQFRTASSVLTTCDAGHPWMGAYIVRARHPYYAVTDADGNFRLDNVPPGSYTLVMWHEGVAVTRTDREKGVPTKYTFEAPYLQTQPVRVAPRGTTQVDLRFSLR